jgi:hypothetical protein
MEEVKGKDMVIVKLELPKDLHRFVKGIGILKGLTIKQVAMEALGEWVSKQGVRVPEK